MLEENVTRNDQLSEIRRGDDAYLARLYTQLRPKFVGWAMKAQRCSHEEAAEVYQQSFTVMYFNVRDGKLTELSSSLSTYLVGIGKRLFYERFRAKVREGSSLDDVPEAVAADFSYLDREAENHRQTLVSDLLAQLGETCREMLRLYYFRKFSMEAIAASMGYKNANVAKRKKYKCLQTLRKMVEK